MALQKASPSSYIVHPILLAILGWLVPGLGFFLLGRKYWSRGALYLVIMHITFAIGIILDGGVVWPVWSISSEGFSIINNLTFVAQLGAGWLALVSLVAGKLGWTALAANEVSAYFELGSFYCLTVGALNYFIVCQSLEKAKRKAFEMLAKQ